MATGPVHLSVSFRVGLVGPESALPRGICEEHQITYQARRHLGSADGVHHGHEDIKEVILVSGATFGGAVAKLFEPSFMKVPTGYSFLWYFVRLCVRVEL